MRGQVGVNGKNSMKMIDREWGGVGRKSVGVDGTGRGVSE
jgi:hypothetical protein